MRFGVCGVVRLDGFQSEERRNVRVIQGGQNLRLAFETRHPLGVLGKLFRQHLEGNLAAELFVLGAPHLAHPTLAELVDDPKIREGRADHLGLPASGVRPAGLSGHNPNQGLRHPSPTLGNCPVMAPPFVAPVRADGEIGASR